MTKISALPTDSAPTSDDYVPAVDSTTSTTKKVPLSALTPMDNPYKFSVYRSTAQNTGNGTFAKIQFNAEHFDTNSNYDSTTNYRYTAPVSGFYQFNASYSAATGASDTMIITLYKNGVEFNRGSRLVHTTAGLVQLVYANLIQLVAGDYVEIYSFASGGARVMEVGATVPHPTFSGFLVSRT